MLDHAISIHFLVIGYSAFFVLFAAYLVSLIIRWRNLKSTLKALEEMAKKQ